MVGPSSILMALMGSGFNGQQFVFHGYLPHEKGQLIKKLQRIELDVRKNGITHVFIETPYRNKNILSTACTVLHPATLLSTAVDLSGENQEIITRSIKEWKQVDFSRFHKRPAVFSIGRS
jgi:16S rRNA (cytidine1402-2'-O)-methyltransferase